MMLNPSQVLQQAEAALSAGRHQAAISLLRRVLLVAPGSSTAIALLILTIKACAPTQYPRLQNRIRAVRPPESRRIFSTLSQYHSATGDADQAIRFQRGAVLSSPEVPVLSLFLSLLRSRSPNSEGLEKQFERAIVLDPRNARFRHVIAEVAGTLGNPYWARRQARSALTMDPTVASSYWSLAISENALLRHDPAVRAARSAVTLTPKDQRHWGLYVELASQSDATAAARVISNHLRVGLTSLDAAVSLLRTLRRAGRIENAREHLAGYFQLHGPAVPDLWCARAELEQEQQLPESAYRSARRAATLAPAASAWIGLCYSLATGNRTQRLRELSKLSVTNAPGVGDVYRATIRSGAPRPERVRDILTLATSTASSDVARRCVFLAAMIGEADELPYETPEQHDRLDELVGGDLDVYAAEVRALYVHKSGRFIFPLPRIDALRRPAHAVPGAPTEGLAILVPTGNRLSDLTAVVTSYLPAISDGVQFVFSVYADRQDTASYLRKLFQSFPNVTIIETAAPYFSKAAAINAAAHLITKKHVFLLDCDCQLAQPDSVSIALERLERAPDDIHSFGYRGMIGLRHALFVDMGKYPDFLVEAQLSLAEHPVKGRVETDDFLLICEFLLRYQTKHYFWGHTRFEMIDLGDACWSAVMRPAEPQEYKNIVYHFGEYRAVQRSDRYTFLNDPMMYRDSYLQRGQSLRIDPFLTKMRRYIERQAAAQIGGSI